MKEEVQELLTEQLKDAYSAEKQALRCMQKTVRKASAPALREGIQMHIEQTQVQIERIEQIMESLKVRPGRKVLGGPHSLDRYRGELRETPAAHMPPARPELLRLYLSYYLHQDKPFLAVAVPVGMWSTRLRCPHIHRR